MWIEIKMEWVTWPSSLPSWIVMIVIMCLFEWQMYHRDYERTCCQWIFEIVCSTLFCAILVRLPSTWWLFNCFLYFKSKQRLPLFLFIMCQHLSWASLFTQQSIPSVCLHTCMHGFHFLTTIIVTRRVFSTFFSQGVKSSTFLLCCQTMQTFLWEKEKL